MTKTIVYYHPKAIKERSNRGSDVRVKSMLYALQKLGHEVIVIAGNTKVRHQKIRELKSAVEAGLSIDYAYGESTNAPIMLAEKTLRPSNCIVDYSFFSWLNKRGIPFGVFYRDIHWYFGFLKQQLPWPLNILLKPLYYLDWYMYDKYSDVLFLPSESMNRHLPRARTQNSFEALPPGFDSSIKPQTPHDVTSKSPLKLLYVGGLEPTVYDITQLIKTVAKRDDVTLTLCCRSDEWSRYRHIYEPHMSDNIELAHVSSDELESYYHDADIFLLVMHHSEYMDFAMPVKLFEAIGYCVPIVTLNYKEVAGHITSNKFGWVVADFEELGKLITKLSTNRSQLSEIYANLLSGRSQHSWEARAINAQSRLIQ